MKRRLSLAIVIAQLTLSAAVISHGAYYSQDFATFNVNAWALTVTNSDGWSSLDALSGSSWGGLCIMNDTNYAGNLPYVKSPLLTNGAGSVSWDVQNVASLDVVYQVQYSTNGSAWTTVGTYTNNSLSWTNKSVAIGTYESVYLRIRKIADSGFGGDYLVMDNINIVPAASYVIITNIALNPSPPLTDNPVQVSAKITPYFQGSNVQAWVYYTNTLATPSRPYGNYVSMTTTGGNYFVASPGIPAHSQPGSTVKYYIYSTFAGVTPLSPTSSPPTGSYSYLLRAAPNDSSYTNMRVSGSASTNMFLAADYLWQAVVKPQGTLINPTFSYASGTNSWGDTNQSVNLLPVYGTAEKGPYTISVSQNVTNYLSFLFNETNLSYSIQNCAYLNFDDWTSVTYGTYTNAENWIVAGGRVNDLGADETNRAFKGRYAVLRYDQTPVPQFVQSPYRPTGIGSVSLWYRNWSTNVTSPTDAAGFIVQKSTNGADGTWVDVNPTVWQTNILSVDWLYFSVLVSDQNSRYVRVVNTNNTTKQSYLCLDEIVVTDPGATVAVTSETRNPSSPQLGQSVTVSINVNPQGGATNLSCTAFFRPEGMQEIAYPMTRTGNTFSATFPPAPPGNVYYYYLCNYDGFNAAPMYYPERAPSVTLVYTNTTNPGSARFQDFHAFDVSGWALTVTNSDGWSSLDSLSGTLFGGLCIMNDTNFAGKLPYVRSPLLTNGAGSISWELYNYQTGPIIYRIQYSPDGSTWTTVSTHTNASLSWTTNSVWIGTYDNVFVRIQKIGDLAQTADYLVLDNIRITPPPADVVISTPFFSPGYPANNQPVTVSCSLTDRNAAYPAYNLVPTLHYSHSGGATGIVSMARQGTNTTWLAGLPGLPVGVVSYYIRCYFNGYCYTNGTYSENQSPAFSPDAPASAQQPVSRHTYTIREFRSDFDHLLVNLTSTNVITTMTQLNDYNWQAILDFAYGVTDPAFILSGFSWFTGTNYWSGTNNWGDAAQTRLSIPLIGTMSPGVSNITLYGPQQGQCVVRFNETNLTYSVQRCVYQDFDRWPASSEFFEESFSRSKVIYYRQSFDTWPTNGPVVLTDDFSDDLWLDATNYGHASPGWDTGLSDAGPAFWTLQMYKIGNHMYPAAPWPASRCALLKDEHDAGTAWLSAGNPSEGVGTLEMDYRCQRNMWRPTLYNNANTWSNCMIEVAMSATTIPASTNRSMVDACALSLYTRYTDANNYYELRLDQANNYQAHLRILKKIAGTYTQVWPNDDYYLQQGLFEGDLGGTNRFRFVTSTEPNGRVYLEGYVNGVRRLRAFDDSTAILNPGAVGINTLDADIMVTNICAGWAQATSFFRWPYIAGPVDTNLLSQAGWTANRVYACDGNNNDYWVGLLAFSAVGVPPAVISPVLPHGVRDVYYRCNKPQATNTMCYTQWSTNLSDWYTIDTYDITSPNVWLDHSFSVTSDVPTNAYVRFLNSTNGSGQTSKLMFDFLVISPSKTNGYYEDFTDGQAQGWSEVGGGSYWRVTTNTPPARYTRPGYAEIPLSFMIMTAPSSQWGSLGSEGVWASNGLYVVSNTAYAHLSHPMRWAEEPGTDGEGIFVRVKHLAADSSLVFDNISVNSWHGKTASDTNGWLATESWVRQNPDNPDLFLAYDYYEGNMNGGYVPDFNLITPVKSGTINNFLITPRLRDTDIAFRFTGHVYIPIAGTWTFYTTSDDGSQLSIDGNLVVNNNYPQGMTERSGTIVLTTGWHDIKVGWAQGTGGYGLEVRYSGPGTAYQQIPDSALMYTLGDKVVELRHSRAYTNRYDDIYNYGQYIRGPWVTNGIGVISFYYKSLNSTNDTVSFKIQTAKSPNTNIWTDVATREMVVDGWKYLSASINTNNSGDPDKLMAARILHTSTNYQAGILLNDLEITDWAGKDQFTWIGYNALITPTETNLLHLQYTGNKAGYLNYSAVDRIADTNHPFMRDYPYLQTAVLTNGIGEISFWYRAWNSYPTFIRMMKSDNEYSTNWAPLCTISNITSQQYIYFKTNFYDPDSHFIRFYCSTLGVGRVCMDELLITAPFGADVSMTNLFTDPAIPLYSNSVNVYVDLFDYFLNPVITNVSLQYYLGTNNWGTWTGGTDIKMNIVGTNGHFVRYKTQSTIPTQAIDQVVQYYVKADFQGMFSEVASPKRCKQFVNPAHYAPIDLNTNNYTAPRIPYYFVYSCLPRQVWINEFNVNEAYYLGAVLTQYVEVCGVEGVNIGKWQLEVYDTSPALQARYAVPAGTKLPRTVPGYGFWLLGSNTLPNADMYLTNYLPLEGGLLLKRSMGAIEQAICYGASDFAVGMTNYGFSYVGQDEPYWTIAPLSLQGTNTIGFTWDNTSGNPHTPKNINYNQTLIPWGTESENPVPPWVEITAFWIQGADIHVNSTGASNWYPTLYYCTNLLTVTPTNWSISSFTQSYTNGTNYIISSAITNLPTVFYKVACTNF